VPFSEQSDEARKEFLAQLDTRFKHLEERIASGFPDGDMVAHRKVHEKYIADAADRAALWKSVRERTITGVVWGAFLFVGVAIWEWLKLEIRK